MRRISVYLDNCWFNCPYDELDQPKVLLETQAKMYIQKMIIDKKLDIIYSYISEYENSRNPNDFNKSSISDFFSNAVVYVDYLHKDEIQAEMNEIIKTGVKEMDALQVASAIIGKADYFLTTNKRLLKYQTDKIHIINPIDFVCDVEV